MLKKIQTWLEAKQKKLQQKQQILKARRYYQLIQEGAAFIKFIEADIEQMKKQQMNRAQRRRFEQSLYHNGQLSAEMIDYYSKKVEYILQQIRYQLNPPKVKMQPKEQKNAN